MGQPPESQPDGVDDPDLALDAEGWDESEIDLDITPREPVFGQVRHEMTRVAHMTQEGKSRVPLIAVDAGPSEFPGYLSISFFTDEVDPVFEVDINAAESDRVLNMVAQHAAGRTSGVNIRTVAGAREGGTTRRVASIMLLADGNYSHMEMYAPPRKVHGSDSEEEPEMALMMGAKFSRVDMTQIMAIIKEQAEALRVTEEAQIASITEVYEGPDGRTRTMRDALEDEPPVAMKKIRRPLVPSTHAELIRRIKGDEGIRAMERGEGALLAASGLSFQMPGSPSVKLELPAGAAYSGSRPIMVVAKNLHLSIDDDSPRIIVECERGPGSKKGQPVVYSTALTAAKLERLARCRATDEPWALGFKDGHAPITIPPDLKIEIAEAAVQLWGVHKLQMEGRRGHDLDGVNGPFIQMGLFRLSEQPGFEAAVKASVKNSFSEATARASEKGHLESDRGLKRATFRA